MEIKTNRYTLYQGNVLDELDNIADGSIDLCITDPPYNVLAGGKVGREEAANYEVNQWDVFETLEKFEKFTRDWFEKLKTKMKPNSFIFIFWSQKYLSLGCNIFDPSRVLTWRYKNLVNSPKGDFAYDYEPIYVVRIGNPRLTKHCYSVLEFTKPQKTFKNDQAVYPTQKPRALVAHLLDKIGLPKDSVVLDCFQGSGIVGEQAVLQGCKYIGIDGSEKSTECTKNFLEAAIKKITT